MPELVAYVKEHGDRVYLQSPVGILNPSDEEVKQFTFGETVASMASEVKDAAPNPRILWMRGQYVEADNANENGDQWRAGDLAIAKLTPVLMPVTLMHDFRVNIGTIADTKLRLPAEDETVPRARIDTTLAIWAHRLKDELVEEFTANAKQGTLMQSMECLSPAYDCSDCGRTFMRLPKMAEQEQWCAHLRGETTAQNGRAAARILRDVVFTGTGLILGTRGARGAYSEAHVEVEELAELHAKAHERTVKRPRRTNKVDIDEAKYAELIASQEKLKTVEAENATLKTEGDTARKAAEDAEAAKVKAEQERDEAKKKADDAAEAEQRAQLSKERFEAFGPKFTEKLASMPSTKTRLEDQAGKLSNEEWTARLEELKESTGIDPLSKEQSPESTAGDKGLLFDKETVASSKVTNTEPSDNDAEPSRDAVGVVLGGLFGSSKTAA